MPSDALANAKRGSARLRVALFDLDHTLLPIDSDYEWGVFTTTIGWTDPLAFARRNDEFFAQYQAGTLDIHDYVRFATDAVRRQGAQAAALAHAQFMQQVVLPALRPQALALVRSHQASDAHVVIVTATNEFVTRPIADAFGVPDLIAVELARDNGPGGTGWITGDIAGVPSAREGKVVRFDQWLQAHGLSRDDVFVTFYSDSTNDLPLLERADAPVATNPDSRLREIASARGWRILDLFTDSQ
ncbi:MAG TPA: HAD-IB family hydrolase [Burkholderiaceae bacterium]|jgi:HAD superfamily hydrolase (TIGR01490 family)|nr:HAD-IB family hydrolase [Burkholderiaceae bacterium]HRA62420.1 HAD-IB family hydrolase [Burkholderiaceae bacterium]